MSSNHTAWVVATDSTTCRIYEYTKKPIQLILVEEISHPENRLRDIEITSDKPGHYKASSGARGAFVQSSDPKAVKIANFSREIAQQLDSGRNKHAYKNLIIIAPPHMNGLLHQHINKHVKDMVTHNIKKDVIHFNDHELIDFLHTHTKYAEG